MVFVDLRLRATSDATIVSIGTARYNSHFEYEHTDKDPYGE